MNLRRFLAPAACALALTLGGAPWSVLAQAPVPSLSGPSMARVATQIVFSGRGYAPNAPVSIAVTAPDGREAYFSSVTGADGSLSYTLQPAAAGQHSIQVIDAAGTVLVRSRLNVFQ